MLKHARRSSTLLPSLSLLWTLCFAQGKRTGALPLKDKSLKQQTLDEHPSRNWNIRSKETYKSIKNCMRASSQSVLVSLRREIQEKGAKRPCRKIILKKMKTSPPTVISQGIGESFVSKFSSHPFCAEIQLRAFQLQQF